MALQRCTQSVAVFFSAFCVGHGIRKRRSANGRHLQLQTSVAGVPIQNYRADAQDFLIVFREGVGELALESMCKGRCSLQGHPDHGGLAFARVQGRSEMEELVRENPGSIEILEPEQTDYIIPELDVEEVGLVAQSNMWGLDRVGVPTRGLTGRGVHIYVQDTGVRGSHSDFGGRATPAIDLTSNSLRQCWGDQSCARDAQGHGTHCAGSAAGSSFGVASEAFVHAVKTLGDDGSGARSWQISALDWITASGERPAIISMSLGGAGTDSAYNRAISAAVAAGITVVVAAGNSDGNSCAFSPAFVPAAITVGATTEDNERAYYSNWGTCNDIMAPGSKIISADAQSDTGSISLSGTSMACPHVSGAAALLLQQSPALKAADILARLGSAGRKGFIAGLKWGDPDAFPWVGAGPAPVSPPTPAPPPTPPPPKCPFFAIREDPDQHGDCQCRNGLYCSLEAPKRNCPTSTGAGGWGGEYFLPTCTECRCFFDWR